MCYCLWFATSQRTGATRDSPEEVGAQDPKRWCRISILSELGLFDPPGLVTPPGEMHLQLLSVQAVQQGGLPALANGVRSLQQPALFDTMAAYKMMPGLRKSTRFLPLSCM